jgi:thiamine biosynthesis lipoprotein
MRSYTTAYKRCRPLLGTFVEISLEGEPAHIFPEITEEAFAQIETVCRQLSFHDPESDLTRLNQACVGKWVEIGPHLQKVLELSLILQKETGGQFNVAIGRPLQAWELLPGRQGNPDWHFLDRVGFEIRRNQARRLLPIKIDLGGIGKGYAVDTAVEILQKRNSMVSGVVNAGGDMRGFGHKIHPVWIRSNGDEPFTYLSTSIQNQSVATSSIARGVKVSPYVDIGERKSLRNPRTVFARAEQCMIADAFTKIALLMPPARVSSLTYHYRVEVGSFQ